MTAKKQSTTDADLRTNEKKWSKPLMDAGWTALPSVIIENQKQLGLTPLDLNIVVYLASKWWTPEGKPYPSKATIAKVMDVHPHSPKAFSCAGGGKLRQARRTPDADGQQDEHLSSGRAH